MSIEIAQAVYLDDGDTITLAQLVERSGLSGAELGDLVDCGALPRRPGSAAEWTFDARCVVVARTARRLRDEYALDDAHSLAVVLRLTQRIEALEVELRALRARRR